MFGFNLKTFFIAAISFSTFAASAYIPNSRFVLSRLAKNSGKGAFQIEQEIQFRTDGEPIVLRERWVVESGDSLRLTVTGPKGSTENFKLETLYKDGKKITVDSTGAVKTTVQPLEFFESYLHFRSSKGVLDTLIHQRILPANVMSLRKSVKSFNGTVFYSEPFIRLARTGGSIAYAFGEATPSNAVRPSAGFWVEQDSFLFRRIRYPSRTEVHGENHLFATGGLRIPRDRTVSWETSSATIRVLSAKAIAVPAAQKVLTAASMTAGRANAAKLPDVQAVQEFYQRFR